MEIGLGREVRPISWATTLDAIRTAPSVRCAMCKREAEYFVRYCHGARKVVELPVCARHNRVLARYTPEEGLIGIRECVKRGLALEEALQKEASHD